MSGKPVIAGRAESECDMLGRATREEEGGHRAEVDEVSMITKTGRDVQTPCFFWPTFLKVVSSAISVTPRFRIVCVNGY
jgi:hypothetical protein